MFKFLGVALVAYAAYKVGEQQATINQYDFFVLNQTVLGNGVQATEYLKVVSGGGFEFVQDVNLATPFLFKEANALKTILRKHHPNFNLILETTNSSLMSQNA